MWLPDATGTKLNCPDRFAPVTSPLAGIGGGLLGGLAGQAGPIVFLYLLSRGITGKRFVQHSSMYIAIASVALTLALGRAGAIGLHRAAVSAICTIPVMLGMWVGQRMREGVSAGLFRKLVLAMVILGGVNMMQSAASIRLRTVGLASARAVPADGRLAKPVLEMLP